MKRTRQILSQLATFTDDADLNRIRFYAIGTAVMVGTPETSGQWCEVEPLHTTEEARRTAERRAEQTASALNEMYATAAARL